MILLERSFAQVLGGVVPRFLPLDTARDTILRTLAKFSRLLCAKSEHSFALEQVDETMLAVKH